MTFHYRRRCTGSAPLTAPQGLCNTKSLQPLTPQSRMPSAALKGAHRGLPCGARRLLSSECAEAVETSMARAEQLGHTQPSGSRCNVCDRRIACLHSSSGPGHSLVMDERDAVPSAAGELKVQITEVSVLIVRYVRCHYVDRCEAQHSSNPHMDTGTMHTLCKSHRPMNCWSPDMARRVHGHVDVRIRALLLCILDEGRPRKDRHRQK